MKTLYCYVVIYDKKEYHFKTWAKSIDDGIFVVESVWNNLNFIDTLPEKRRPLNKKQIKYNGKFDNLTASHVLSIDFVNIDHSKYSSLFNGVDLAIKALEDSV